MNRICDKAVSCDEKRVGLRIPYILCNFAGFCLYMFGLISILLSVTLLTENPITGKANMSVLVENMTTGERIDEYRSEHVVPPASVMKLLTTGAALETLGADFRFTTTLEYTGKIEKGVLYGDLYIRGEGDPSLGDKRRSFLPRWVRAIQAAGIRRIEGSIIADMSAFDAEATNPAWLCEDAGNYYAPGIFGINYMANTMNIVLKSGAVGTIAEVTRTEPLYPNLQFINHIRCTNITYDGAFVSGLPFSNERYLTGCIPSKLGIFGVKGDIPNPGLLLAQHLQQCLLQAGIQVKMPAHYVADYNPLLPPRNFIYAHKSDSLGALIVETNINSNNLYAEAIFRYLGLQYATPATIHNSCDFLREFWRRRGVDVSTSLVKDGCGLAPQDAVSAATFVQLLRYMAHSKYADVWFRSLPVSGQTGTLKSLCRGTELEGRIHAKSGTISGTKNFAGYIDMPDGEKWVFAILINSAPGKARNIQTVIEKYLLDVYQANK